jgi:hypothetical protein
MTPYLAIDPGALGGFAWQLSDSDLVQAKSMQKDNKENAVFIRSFNLASKIPKVIIEDVPSFAGTNRPGSRMFPLGFNCGLLEGASLACLMTVIKIRPHEWQKHFNIGGRSDCKDPQDWKRRLKEHAQLLFPYLKVTLKTADALLLLAYAKNKHL